MRTLKPHSSCLVLCKSSVGQKEHRSLTRESRDDCKKAFHVFFFYAQFFFDLQDIFRFTMSGANAPDIFSHVTYILITFNSQAPPNQLHHFILTFQERSPWHCGLPGAHLFCCWIVGSHRRRQWVHLWNYDPKEGYGVAWGFARAKLQVTSKTFERWKVSEGPVNENRSNFLSHTLEVVNQKILRSSIPGPSDTNLDELHQFAGHSIGHWILGSIMDIQTSWTSCRWFNKVAFRRQGNLIGVRR